MLLGKTAAGVVVCHVSNAPALKRHREVLTTRDSDEATYSAPQFTLPVMKETAVPKIFLLSKVVK